MFLRGQPIMKPKFEEGICRIRSSIANHLFLLNIVYCLKPLTHTLHNIMTNSLVQSFFVRNIPLDEKKIAVPSINYKL
jgi:hypothetical protein